MILICFGTRPEYIKVKSLIDNLSNVKTCFTGQHFDLLNDIHTDYKLNFTKDKNTNKISNIIVNTLNCNHIFDGIDYVLVQGDTTSAFSMALSAFNNKKKIIHLEAGLRTNNIYDPYPEELNRQLISKLANIHLCPTIQNKINLNNENIKDNIYVTGNTGLDNIDKNNCIYGNKILITLHRRNNVPIIEKWFEAIEKIASLHEELEFILPMHPNPSIQKYKHILKSVNIIKPLSHSSLIDILKKCKFVISDSGGIQEEASFLNKKIIICRKTTERTEIIGKHGIFCKNPSNLYNIFEDINLNYMINDTCPYGDGNAYKKVIDIIKKF
jgi:UDP-N-acetylglucosamine 2-epimerase (non-hydrolysing)